MIEVRELRVRAGGRDLLRDVSFRLPLGELWVVLGENGAGKSTLLRAVAGDITPAGGEVRLGGVPLPALSLRALARRRAVVTQDVSLAFPLRALEVVLLGRLPHLRGAEGPADLAMARAALRSVDAEHLCERPYPVLSGGERQRVQLARALCQLAEAPPQGGRYLLLDEPTASLDLRHQHGILAAARRLSRQGTAVLAVLHDLNLAAAYADRVLLLHEGRPLGLGTPEQILVPTLLEEALGVRVAVVRAAGRRLLVPIQGPSAPYEPEECDP